MRLIDSESLYQRFLDYKLKHPTRYTDIDEIRIVISDEPTVDVLEQIRAEIYQLHCHPKLDFIKTDEVVDMALDIIDRQIGDKE